MREFPFELALCAHLEATEDQIIARQIGGSVHAPTNRVLDVLCVEPGPEIEDRTELTSKTIPAAAIESEVGVGRACDPVKAFDCSPQHARKVTERAEEIGFFERTNGGVRQVARYPENWFDTIRAIENKPDLDVPGDLLLQLRKDVSLALVDEVVLATESYVTGAHLNRIPEEVGVWRFYPETGEREVIREPESLPTHEAGTEILDTHTGRSDIAVVGTDEKARKRRRIAERAYGKGWRTYDFPACKEASPTTREGSDGLPYCAWKDRLVNPANCGADCPGHDPADPLEFDNEAARDGRTPWVAEPDGKARRQSGLDKFW